MHVVALPKGQHILTIEKEDTFHATTLLWKINALDTQKS